MRVSPPRKNDPLRMLTIRARNPRAAARFAVLLTFVVINTEWIVLESKA